MKAEINLENKEEAARQVALIQKSIDELLEVIETQKNELLNNVKVMKEAEDHIKTLEKSTIDLTQTIKGIHMILGSRKDKFEGDEEMNELMNHLSVFVMGSGSIKIGVMENERKNNNS